MTAFADRYWWSNDGLRLHCRDYPGPDHLPPILCLPGLTRNARDFEPLAERLEGRWRIIAVDFRGRGDSGYARDATSYVPLTYAQDVEALLRELKVARFVGIGSSLGALILLLLASTRPGRLAGAAINDAGPMMEAAGVERVRAMAGQGRSYPTWLHAARALAEAQGAAHPALDLSGWLALAKQQMKLGAGGRIAYDYDMRIAEALALPGGGIGFDLWPALAALRGVPALILRGALSDVLSAAAAERMAAALDGGPVELLEVPGAGHTPTLSEPEAVAAIGRLLARVAGETVAP